MFFSHDSSPQPVHTGTWTGFLITMGCNLVGGAILGALQIVEDIDKLTVLFLHLLGVISVTIGIVVGVITLFDKIEARVGRKKKKSDTPHERASDYKP